MGFPQQTASLIITILYKYLYIHKEIYIINIKRIRSILSGKSNYLIRAVHPEI